MNKQEIRLLVRMRDDFQATRKQMDNRIGRKADGTDQEIGARDFDSEFLAYLTAVSDHSRQQEKIIERMLLAALKQWSIYTEFLSKVKGVGPIVSAWIISEIDIERATTVSKIWQYAGLNPSLVRGTKRKEVKGKPVLYVTDEFVRGDKKTPGFVAPFNGKLRTVLVGVLADGFIKSQSPYCMNFYYPYKERLAQEDNLIAGEETAWKDVKAGRRDRAAKRYMIKEFLKDLYSHWRALEGLPVRPPYSEEYLGKKHEVRELVTA